MSSCERCRGSGFLPAPDVVRGERVFTNVVSRCPDCARAPAPRPRKRRHSAPPAAPAEPRERADIDG